MTEPVNEPETPDATTIPESWKQVLRQELLALPPQERFVMIGETISWITYNLLPDLGTMRRDCIVGLLDDEGWDTIRISEHFGMRRSTVIRLLDEGRTARKQMRQRREAIQYEEPPELDAA